MTRSTYRRRAMASTSSAAEATEPDSSDSTIGQQAASLPVTACSCPSRGLAQDPTHWPGRTSRSTPRPPPERARATKGTFTSRALNKGELGGGDGRSQEPALQHSSFEPKPRRGVEHFGTRGEQIEPQNGDANRHARKTLSTRQLEECLSDDQHLAPDRYRRIGEHEKAEKASIRIAGCLEARPGR